MPGLKQIVEENTTPAGRVFDLIIQALIVISLIDFSLETLPGLTPRAQDILWTTELVIVIIFTAEYLLRLAVADNKLRFIFSFYGLIDLFAILPFYLAPGVDLRSIRVLRFLRLFQAFKLVRYSRALQRFHQALLIAKEQIILFFMVTGMLLYFAAVGIYYFENDAQPQVFSSVFTSLWWAIITLTTVGYGDVYPITVGGRIFTCMLLMIGLGIVAVPAGIVASALSQARELHAQVADDKD